MRLLSLSLLGTWHLLVLLLLSHIRLLLNVYDVKYLTYCPLRLLGVRIGIIRGLVALTGNPYLYSFTSVRPDNADYAEDEAEA